MVTRNFLLHLKNKTLLFFCLILALCPIHSNAVENIDTETVFALFKGNVVQIQVIDQGAPSKTNIGSGFIITDSGYVITNYHVIAELINRPGLFRAEFIKNDNTKGELKLLTLDVVHDLALLYSDQLKGSGLKIESNPPKKGERLYAFGNPFDLGLTIVEGTYNGLLEKSLYEKIHFTGSLNPGMSGGPTLNRHGRVVGVNVSTAGNQVSFLVPSVYVENLISSEQTTTSTSEASLELVRDQLFENQNHIIGTLLDEPFSLMDLGDFRLPGELKKFISCWGGTSPEKDKLYDLAYQDCSTSDDIFLAPNFSSGIIRFKHKFYTSPKAGPLRFYSFLEQNLNSPHLFLSANERQVTNYECSTDIVNHNDIHSKVIFCMREYKKLHGLYDVFLSATTLESSDQALHTSLVAAGVSYENAIRFTQTYLEEINYKQMAEN